MDEAARTRRIRGTDGYGVDRWVTVIIDGAAEAVTVHAPVPVRLDRYGSTRLLAAIGEGDWRLQTGAYWDRDPKEGPNEPS